MQLIVKKVPPDKTIAVFLSANNSAISTITSAIALINPLAISQLETFSVIALLIPSNKL